MSTNIETKAHAVYSASGSKRWLECAGSIKQSESAPPQKESKYAEEGTRAHYVLDYLVKNRKKRLAAAAFLRKSYPTEMVVFAEKALDYIEKRLRENEGAELLSDARVKLPVSEPGQFGTLDIAIVTPYGKLIVMDYKYGQGVIVDPEENSQGLYYALGIAHEYGYDFSEVEIIIIQPRAFIGGDGIRSWTTTIENLIEWREKFERGIKRCKEASNAKDIEPYLKSGDHCQFCPAKIGCPEIKNKALRQAQAAFDDETGLVTVPEMKALNLPIVLPAIEKLEVWIKAVKAYATELLESGEKIPGYDLVEARGQRRWTDLTGVFEAVKKFKVQHLAFSDPELLSPAQFEKACKDAGKEFPIEKFCAVISSGNKSLKKVEVEVKSEEIKTKKKTVSK